jgi:hypothetical protein
MIYQTPRKDGGMDFHLTLTADQLKALGEDAGLVLRRTAYLIDGLAALRAGGQWMAGAGQLRPAVPADWALVISAVTELSVVGEAVTAAAVREHADTGGSVSELGWVMNVPRGTAQNRREKWIGTTRTPQPPGRPERWAREGGRLLGPEPAGEMPDADVGGRV